MLKKRIALCVCFALMLVLMGSSVATAQMKVAYVNTQQILTVLPSAVAAGQKLQEEEQTWVAELRGMEEELRNLQQQLEQQSLLLSEAKRKEKTDEIQALYMNAQQYQQEKWGQEGEFLKRRAELYQPVYDEINAAINKIRKDEGYDFIFDSAALLDADDKHDLTNKVLQGLGVDVSKQE